MIGIFASLIVCIQGFAQDECDVLRRSIAAMHDLMTAGKTVGNQPHLWRRGPQRWQEREFSHGLGRGAMLGFEPETSGHATARNRRLRCHIVS